jgi:hypothetical protein
MYAIEGRRFQAGDRGYEPTLAVAHERRIRPLCLCTAPGVPVYISHVNGAFRLKRMPLTASRHAVECVHFEPRATAMRTPRTETTVLQVPATRSTRLRVAFSLFDGDASAETRTGRSHGRTGEGVETRLSLRGLMQFLWREAELTRWCPAFAGKRSWTVVRNHLLRGAKHKILQGEDLPDALFLPEAFYVTDKENLRRRRALRFHDAMNRHDQPRKKMILIGEVKEIVPPPRSRLVIKHLPELPFSLEEGLHARMHFGHETEIALWQSASDVRLVVTATFSLGKQAQPVIDNLCLVTTTFQWLPVDDRFEFRLVDKLVREYRSFEKLLGFNQAVPSRAPSAALTDTGHLRQILALERDRLARHLGADHRLERCAPPIDELRIDWVWRVGEQDPPRLPRRLE